MANAPNDQLPPESFRQLRALVALHGITPVLKALDEIAREHAANQAETPKKS